MKCFVTYITHIKIKMLFRRTLSRVYSMDNLEQQLEALLSNPLMEYFWLENSVTQTETVQMMFPECSVKTVVQKMGEGFDQLFMAMKSKDIKRVKLTQRDDLEGFEYYVEVGSYRDEFSPSVMQKLLPLREVFFEKIADRIVTLTVDETQSFRDLKTALIQIHNAPVTAFDQMCFVHGGHLLMDSDIVWDHVEDKSTITVFCKGPGGAAKRGRASLDTEEMFFVPTVTEKDCEEIKLALAVKTVNIEPWVKSLDQKTTQYLFDTLEDQAKTGNVTILVNPYLDAVKEYAQLEDII
jgi:hypothetical protein